MTILTSQNSQGTRRCDSSCHNAQHPKCACICGGRYHGKGSAVAQEQLTKDWLGEHWRETKAAMEATGGSLHAVQLGLGL